MLVNTARGDILDVGAAERAVVEGRLRGLSVDVFPEEPYGGLAASHPAVRFTPHSAGYVHDLGHRVAQEVNRTLSAWLASGEMPHVIA